MKNNLYALAILLLCCVGKTMAQFSKTHYIPPVVLSKGPSAAQNFVMYISTASSTEVGFDIYLGGASTPFVSGTTRNNNPAQIDLNNKRGGFGMDLIFEADKVTDQLTKDGLIVVAQEPVSVTVKCQVGNPDAFALISKGLSGTGTTFRTGMFTNDFCPIL